MEYKVLTLWEPWASLVVNGIKKIETRPKPTNWTVEKGTYLIHAAKKWTKEQRDICLTEPFFSELCKFKKWFGAGYLKGDEFNFGHIIGSVEIEECHKLYRGYSEEMPNIIKCYNGEDGEDIELKEPELSFGDYREGRYAWILQNPRILKTPIPYKGGQGYYQNFKGDESQLILEDY